MYFLFIQHLLEHSVHLLSQALVAFFDAIDELLEVLFRLLGSHAELLLLLFIYLFIFFFKSMGTDLNVVTNACQSAKFSLVSRCSQEPLAPHEKAGRAPASTC